MFHQLVGFTFFNKPTKYKKLYIGLYFEVWIQTQDLQKISPCKDIFAKNINKMFHPC